MLYTHVQVKNIIPTNRNSDHITPQNVYIFKCSILNNLNPNKNSKTLVNKNYSVITLTISLSMFDDNPYILTKIIHLPPRLILGIFRQLIDNQNQNIIINPWLRVHFPIMKPTPEINCYLYCNSPKDINLHFTNYVLYLQFEGWFILWILPYLKILNFPASFQWIKYNEL